MFCFEMGDEHFYMHFKNERSVLQKLWKLYWNIHREEYFMQYLHQWGDIVYLIK